MWSTHVFPEEDKRRYCFFLFGWLGSGTEHKQSIPESKKNKKLGPFQRSARSFVFLQMMIPQLMKINS